MYEYIYVHIFGFSKLALNSWHSSCASLLTARIISVCITMSSFLLISIAFTYSFVSMCMGECVPWCTYVGEEITCMNRFSPAMWVPGIKLKRSALAASLLAELFCWPLAGSLLNKPFQRGLPIHTHAGQLLHGRRHSAKERDLSQETLSRRILKEVCFANRQ